MYGYSRILNLNSLLLKKSLFLFGPRATGKTSLIRHQLLPGAVFIDLLRSDAFLRLSERPGALEEMVRGQAALMQARVPPRRPSDPIYVVIDEVQKVPGILDEVHRLIETERWRFLLTGSSARKLKRGQANLLAGRAWQAELFPLCSAEIPELDLGRYLRYGGLPAVYSSSDAAEDLAAYVNTYLYEEIQAEGLVRNLSQFSRFLAVAALSSGQLINFAQVASDSGVSASTVREHYSILTDTLVGFFVEPWKKSRSRKAIATAKYYLFDCGVTHAIAGTKTLDRNSDLYGRSFEHWIAMELRAYLSYRRIHTAALQFWRSTHQHEVDFVIGDHTLIEVKATKSVQNKHFHGLRALMGEAAFKHAILVSEDPIIAMREGVLCLPWQEFVKRLWAGEFFA